MRRLLGISPLYDSSTSSDCNVPREGSENETEVPRTPSATLHQRGRRRQSWSPSRTGAAAESSSLDTSHPPCRQKPLRPNSGPIVCPPMGFRAPQEHENRPNRWSVGCTSRSASPLSAHF